MKCAIVDDDRDMVDQLAGHISRECGKRSIPLEIDRYYSGEVLLENYRSGYDIAFLDKTTTKMLVQLNISVH